MEKEQMEKEQMEKEQMENEQMDKEQMEKKQMEKEQMEKEAMKKKQKENGKGWRKNQARKEEGAEGGNKENTDVWDGEMRELKWLESEMGIKILK